MRVKLSILLCALAGLTLGATPAFAARGHAYGSTFAGPGTGSGQLSEPEGVAVNEATGDVYVVDKGNDRVDEFEAGGRFVRAWGWGVNEASPKKELQECTTTTGCLPGEAGTGAGQFEKPEGIAVDNSTASTDPSRGDVYVFDRSQEVIDKFSASGSYIGQITVGQITGTPAGSSTSLMGVAVGTTGEVWVDSEVQFSEPGVIEKDEVYDFSDAVANSFIESRTAEKAKGTDSLFFSYLYPGFAVDTEDNFYLRTDDLDPGGDYIWEYDSKGGQPLDEGVGPSPPGEQTETERGIATELKTDDVYIDSYDSVDRYGRSGAPIESLSAANLSAGSGVAVNSATGQVYVADSASDVLDEFVLEPPGPPRVLGASVSKVTGDSAVFAAEVEPRSLAGEKGTTYRFEYGPCASPSACATTSGYGKEVSGLVPPSFEVDAVSLSVQGLQAHTAYHFRVVAENAYDSGNPVEGKAQAFITQGAGGELVLPDGRAWELVSPPDKHGALIEPINEQGVVQAAVGGGAFTYLASVPTESEPQGFTNEVQVLSTRGPGGWSSRDISVPDAAATGKSVGEGEEYRFFSEDLSVAVVAPFGPFVALSSSASESTAYLRDDTDGAYRPLVTGCPGEGSGEACAPSIEGQADVPPGTVFGGEVNGQCAEPSVVACGPKARAATPDLSHIVLQSSVGLTEGTRGGLYEWEAGHLTYVGIPDGTESVDALSPDGSYVVFAGGSEGKSGLLVRDTASGETVALDAAQPSGCGSCVSGGGVYQAASADASKIFFTDEHALTGSSGSGRTVEGEGDLYECEIVGGPGGLKCDLTDLTPKGGGGKEALVQGVVGVSKDGDWVYFVADGVLASSAAQGSCKIIGGKLTAECDLYAEHYNGSGWEAPRLVTVVSGADAPDWSVQLSYHTARVSPDGGRLAFMSQRSLTGYDNNDANSGKPDEEVYLYDAAGEGLLVCASCNPTGTRPEGMEYAHMGLARGGGGAWPSDTWIAGNVPGWTPLEDGVASYQSRYLSDEGRLFFNSSDQLVPQDGNHQEDVYEYEPPGIGSCTTESATYGEQAAGCVGLISSGSSGTESAFLDASENGSEVFFLTAAKLAPQDYDSSVDVYDARECSPSSPCVAAPAVSPGPCENAEACRAASTPPSEVFGAPPSATFNGLGNITPEAPKPATKAKAKPLTRAQKLAKALKACKRDKSKAEKVKCDAKARKEYGPVKPKRKG